MNDSTIFAVFDYYGEILGMFEVPVLLDLSEIVHHQTFSYAYHFNSKDPQSKEDAIEVLVQTHVVDVKQMRGKIQEASSANGEWNA